MNRINRVRLTVAGQWGVVAEPVRTHPLTVIVKQTARRMHITGVTICVIRQMQPAARHPHRHLHQLLLHRAVQCNAQTELTMMAIR